MTNIPFLQAHTSNFYSGLGGNSIKYIVVHYTAGNGDTAMNNAQYFHNNSGLQASAHYFVDEHGVVQSVRYRRCMALRRSVGKLASPAAQYLYEPQQPGRGDVLGQGKRQVCHYRSDGRPHG